MEEPFEAATGYALGKTAGIDPGTNIESVSPVRASQPGLGAEERFLFPAFPSTAIAFSDSAVNSWRQKSRNTGTPADGVRDFLAVTPKPEVGTVFETVSQPTKQVAWVETDVPNALIEMMGVRAGIEVDLRLAFNKSLDHMVTAAIAAANPPNSSTGANSLEQLVYGIEVILAAGYQPSVVAASPAYFIALALMEDVGYLGGCLGDKMASLISRLGKVPVPGLPIPLIADASALGTLYASPTRFAVFEQDAGATNQSTVRTEATATFVVQRLNAAVQVTSGS